jgi:pentatricopeptide repeat protein
MRSLNIPHDYATFVVALKSCTDIDNYGLGLQVHCLVIQMGFESDVVTCTALVDMYSTCKKLDHAFRIFVEIPERNSVYWTTVIVSYV